MQFYQLTAAFERIPISRIHPLLYVFTCNQQARDYTAGLQRRHRSRHRTGIALALRSMPSNGTKFEGELYFQKKSDPGTAKVYLCSAFSRRKRLPEAIDIIQELDYGSAQFSI
jgi:hypothetical protein